MNNETHDVAETRADLEEFRKNIEKNVFIMMRYSGGDHFDAIERTIRKELSKYNLRCFLAKDAHFDSQLWENLRIYMDCSRYGIAVFEQISDEAFNPNISLELGYMLATGKRCLLLNGLQTRLHSDLFGFLYRDFSVSSIVDIECSIAQAVSEWVEKDLGLSAIRPAELITSSDLRTSLIARTQRIVTALEGDFCGMTPPSELVIRIAANLTSLAISEKERPYTDPEYFELLMNEKQGLLKWLERGATIKCIIAPSINPQRVASFQISQKEAEDTILARYGCLLELLSDGHQNLQIVYSSQLPHPNLLIFGTNLLFIGRRRYFQSGFQATTVIYDPEVIRGEIESFDTLFCDAAAVILHPPKGGFYVGPEVREEDLCSKELRDKVVLHLVESMKDVSQAARRITK